MSHDGRYAVTVNNGDETISVIDTSKNEVVATLEGGPDMTGVNFAAGKAFVISATSGFVYVYDESTWEPAGRIKIGVNIQLETATTDVQDQKLYLASSTDHSIYVIDAATQAVQRVTDVGLYPWGTHIMASKDNYCH
jgi:YVTN family beta-propeller protein